jgi:hypothetical protein
LLERIPDFFSRLAGVRERLEKINRRPFTVKVLDFGEVFWTDFGQHLALRQNLSALLAEDSRGRLTRALFNLPEEKDARGNRLVNATIPDGADIRDSLLVDAQVRSPDTLIHGGIIIGGTYGRLWMPQGGTAMFCTVGELSFDGPNAIALQSILPTLRLPEGGRHATVITARGPVQLYTNEAISDYKGSNYFQPLDGNPVSFDEASNLVEAADPQVLVEVEHQARRAVKELN